MKKIHSVLDSFTSSYDELPTSWKVAQVIFIIVFILDINGIIPTPAQIQTTKTATIELQNGTRILMSDYSLLDYYDSFEIEDYVYVELNDNCIPSSVRHFYDAYEQDGRMYAQTTLFGSYPANLISGKIIDVKETIK